VNFAFFSFWPYYQLISGCYLYMQTARGKISQPNTMAQNEFCLRAIFSTDIRDTEGITG